MPDTTMDSDYADKLGRARKRLKARKGGGCKHHEEGTCPCMGQKSFCDACPVSEVQGDGIKAAPEYCPLRIVEVDDVKARMAAVKRDPKTGKTVSSRSKTGSPACSQAMSLWKTQGMSPAIAAQLGKCRAMARQRKAAEGTRLAGNEARAQAWEARAARAESGGLITKKERLAKAKELRAARANSSPKPVNSSQSKDSSPKPVSKFSAALQEARKKRDAARSRLLKRTGGPASIAKQDPKFYRKTADEYGTAVSGSAMYNASWRMQANTSAEPYRATQHREGIRTALIEAPQLVPTRVLREYHDATRDNAAFNELADRAARISSKQAKRRKMLAARQSAAPVAEPTKQPAPPKKFTGYHGTPKRVTITKGDNAGASGYIEGQIQKRYSKEADTYRIQLAGYGKPGGYSGKVTATPDMLADAITPSTPRGTAARLARAKELRAARAQKQAEGKGPKAEGRGTAFSQERARQRAIDTYKRSGGDSRWIQDPNSSTVQHITASRINEAARLRSVPKAERRKGYRTTPERVQYSKDVQTARANSEKRAAATGMDADKRKELARGIRDVRREGDKITKARAKELQREAQDRWGRTASDDGYGSRAAAVTYLLGKRSTKPPESAKLTANPNRHATTVKKILDRTLAGKVSPERSAKVQAAFSKLSAKQKTAAVQQLTSSKLTSGKEAERQLATRLEDLGKNRERMKQVDIAASGASPALQPARASLREQAAAFRAKKGTAAFGETGGDLAATRAAAAMQIKNMRAFMRKDDAGLLKTGEASRSLMAKVKKPGMVLDYAFTGQGRASLRAANRRQSASSQPPPPSLREQAAKHRAGKGTAEERRQAILQRASDIVNKKLRPAANEYKQAASKVKEHESRLQNADLRPWEMRQERDELAVWKPIAYRKKQASDRAYARHRSLQAHLKRIGIG